MFGTHGLGIFLAASFFVWITPGPDTMYIVTRSVTQGRRAGLFSALGIGAGCVLHTLLAAFGLSVLLATSAWAFAVFKTVGAFYLIYLGVRAFRSHHQPEVAKPQPNIGDSAIFRQGFLTNAFNPKVAIFFLAFLPQFVDSSIAPGPLPFLFLGAVFVIGGTIWCVLIALLASSARMMMQRNSLSQNILHRVAGCVYIALGVHLLRSRFQPS